MIATDNVKALFSTPWAVGTVNYARKHTAVSESGEEYTETRKEPFTRFLTQLPFGAVVEVVDNNNGSFKKLNLSAVVAPDATMTASYSAFAVLGILQTVVPKWVNGAQWFIACVTHATESKERVVRQETHKYGYRIALIADKNRSTLTFTIEYIGE